MKLRAFALSILATGLTACASAPTGEGGRAVTLADAGPAPADALGLINRELRTRLKDPESARVAIAREPRRVVFATSSFNKGGAGWEICAQVNAKNSFGAYTGVKQVFMLWNTGRVVDFIDGDLGNAFCREKNDYRLQVG